MSELGADGIPVGVDVLGPEASSDSPTNHWLAALVGARELQKTLSEQASLGDPGRTAPGDHRPDRADYQHRRGQARLGHLTPAEYKTLTTVRWHSPSEPAVTYSCSRPVRVVELGDSDRTGGG
ncbi:hypothetical protein CTKZ_21270 [Cellulomonas algicola]|uniref:Uncharacterized protein n=1 Tax=Cellulomonas algicola TaxID=2071633 RepID=A0A401V0Y7_9CELL|nr:hypothetical protein CTKZ_21270 [Cellulomonas algicola]